MKFSEDSERRVAPVQLQSSCLICNGLWTTRRHTNSPNGQLADTAVISFNSQLGRSKNGRVFVAFKMFQQKIPANTPEKRKFCRLFTGIKSSV